MKKIITICMVSLLALSAFSQSEKYMKTMEAKLAGFDTTRDAATLQELANTFERIGDAAKTQWLPYYYAALCQVNIGFQASMGGGAATTTDPYADKAEALLNKSEALSKDNSEIWVVRKQIATLRLLGDVMHRYMTYGKEGAEALAMAKKLNPDNPRIYVLEATDKFNTPEQYGGSKEEAKKLFGIAQEKFNSFKPETDIAPDWGRAQMNYFLSQIQ